MAYFEGKWQIFLICKLESKPVVIHYEAAFFKGENLWISIPEFKKLRSREISWTNFEKKPVHFKSVLTSSDKLCLCAAWPTFFLSKSWRNHLLNCILCNVIPLRSFSYTFPAYLKMRKIFCLFPDSAIFFLLVWKPNPLRQFWRRKTSHTPVASSASSARQWSQVIKGRSRLIECQLIPTSIYSIGIVSNFVEVRKCQS